MAVFVMMVGVAGSGKSTEAKKILTNWKEGGFVKSAILSSDIIRAELYGDAAIQGDPNKVFRLMRERLMVLLADGYNVIYDATNLVAKKRAAVVRMIRDVYKDKVKCLCRVVTATEDVCVARQEERDRKVPADVIHRQICQFEMPFYNEGWNNITIQTTNHNFRVHDYLTENWNMNQKNSHHTLSLGEHCLATANGVQQLAFGDNICRMGKWGMESDWVSTVLDDAAMYHDVGKIATQKFREGDDNAHYYNHNNYSAWLMACDCEGHEYLDGWIMSIALVQWHMQCFMVYDMNAWLAKKEFSPLFCFLLDLLHRADVDAH